MTEYEGTEVLVNGIEQSSQGFSSERLELARKQKTTITPEQILEKGRDFMCQYHFQKKREQNLLVGSIQRWAKISRSLYRG